MDLRFPAPGRKPYPSTLQRALVFGLIAFAAASIVGIVVFQVAAGGPVDGPGGVWGFVGFFGFIVFLLAEMGFVVVWYRGFTVRAGVMRLPTPRRLGRGRRVRYVRLLDIVDAEPITQPGADPGVLLTLRDGTEFPLFEADAPRMKGFLDQLVAVVQVRRRTLSERSSTSPATQADRRFN